MRFFIFYIVLFFCDASYSQGPTHTLPESISINFIEVKKSVPNTYPHTEVLESKVYFRLNNTETHITKTYKKSFRSRVEHELIPTAEFDSIVRSLQKLNMEQINETNENDTIWDGQHWAIEFGNNSYSIKMTAHNPDHEPVERNLEQYRVLFDYLFK